MENSDNKIMVATFQSHYGALLLKKNIGDRASTRSVPRSLSSSCGTCTFVSNASLEEILNSADMELLEAVYEAEDKGYKKIYG